MPTRSRVAAYQQVVAAIALATSLACGWVKPEEWLATHRASLEQLAQAWAAEPGKRPRSFYRLGSNVFRWNGVYIRRQGDKYRVTGDVPEANGLSLQAALTAA